MAKKKKAVKSKKKKPVKHKKKSVPRKKAKKIIKNKKTAVKAKSKKTAKKKAARKAKSIPAIELPWRVALEGEHFIGIIDDYYQHVGVVALYLKEPLQLGDRIHVRGYATDFTQIVSSMQIEHQSVEKAGIGDAVGIKVDSKAHKGNFVYKITG